MVKIGFKFEKSRAEQGSSLGLKRSLYKGLENISIGGRYLGPQDIFKRNISDPDGVLARSSVCILGLGGLGSNIGVYLARSGIGRLVLVDFDQVEASNLNRQYYSLGHIGMKKTQALLEVIRSINPFIDLEVIDTKINRDNIMDIVKGQQIICEALDDPATKSMVVSEVLANSDDKLVVAASGMAGLGDANLIRTRRKLSRLYICGDERSDFELIPGMMAPRVSICAGHQANIILRLLLGLEG
mgnify:CR=1 FL=1